MLLRRVLICFLSAIFLISCAPYELHTLHMTDGEFQQKWLPFLEKGKTTKEEVLLKLGGPSGQFEGEKIFTYRLLIDEKEGLAVVSRELDPRSQAFTLWRRAEYSLVLVFDKDHILQKYSLIQVR